MFSVGIRLGLQRGGRRAVHRPTTANRQIHHSATLRRGQLGRSSKNSFDTFAPALCRNVSTFHFSQRNSDGLWSKGFLRQNWIAVGIFATLISSAIGAAAYYMYLYNKLVEQPLSVYPAVVAKSIKAALFYASHGDISKMATNFKAAITAAENSGMHPLSDEVAGLKIEFAQLLLKAKDGEFAERAIEVMEHVLDEAVAGAKYFEKQARWHDRNKVLKRAVLLGYKVGEMYQDLNKDDRAEEAMVWSTETLLKEIRRLEENGIDEDQKSEGDWFDAIAVSACLEKLAGQYQKTNQFTLATPLYLRAITLVPHNTCHALTLMNNLATTMSNQDLPPPTAKNTITRNQLVENAKMWAEKAIQLNFTIHPPVRTKECDSACVAATHNLAEFASMLGDKNRARQLFSEALILAKTFNMEEGIERATEGLKRVEGSSEISEC